jgi:hypothetical protein
MRGGVSAMNVDFTGLLLFLILLVVLLAISRWGSSSSGIYPPNPTISTGAVQSILRLLYRGNTMPNPEAKEPENPKKGRKTRKKKRKKRKQSLTATKRTRRRRNQRLV